MKKQGKEKDVQMGTHIHTHTHTHTHTDLSPMWNLRSAAVNILIDVRISEVAVCLTSAVVSWLTMHWSDPGSMWSSHLWWPVLNSFTLKVHLIQTLDYKFVVSVLIFDYVTALNTITGFVVFLWFQGLSATLLHIWISFCTKEKMHHR